jgi:hypothetical protein
MELERSENILIITHQAILRCIYAYFMNVPQERSPWMEVPLHTLIKLTPRAYKTEEERLRANIPAVSTWREKGSLPVHADSPVGTPAVESEAVTSVLPFRTKEAESNGQAPAAESDELGKGVGNGV